MPAVAASARCPSCGRPARGRNRRLGCRACGPRKSDPTPARIRSLCLEIQAGWSPQERASRSGGLDAQAVIAAEECGGSDARERSGRRYARRQAEALPRLIARAALALGGVYAAALDPNWKPGPEWG